MPTYEVTYQAKGKKRSLTKTVKVQAIGETHMRQQLYDYAKKVLKKFIQIIYYKEVL